MPLCNTIEESSLKGGDVVYCWRNRALIPYIHTGICVINATSKQLSIIHVQDNRESKQDLIVQTSVEEFTQGATLKRVHTSPNFLERSFLLAGTHIPAIHSPKKVMQIAIREYRKQKRRNTVDLYNVIDNNCEIFTTFCLTGKRKSAQTRGIEKILKTSIRWKNKLSKWSSIPRRRRTVPMLGH